MQIEISQQYGASRGSQSGRSSRARGLNLNKLGVFSDGFFLARGSGKSAEKTDSPYGFQNQLNEDRSPITTYIFSKVSGAISYPAEFKAADISGEVTGVLRFDSQGNWVDRPEEFRSSNLMGRYLRMYILRQLRSVFAESIPERIWQTVPPQAIAIDARFLFSILAAESIGGARMGPQFGYRENPSAFSEYDPTGNQSVEQGIGRPYSRVIGKKIVVYRVHLNPRLAWKIGPLAGYGAMPAVGVDPGWFVDRVRGLFRERVKIDPLEKWRLYPDW